jgi:hypothetical protein
MEIWINSQPCKGIKLTTRHTQARRAQWVATIHDVTKMLGRVLNHIVHPWSEVRYRPTHRHTKLFSLGIPYVTYASVHFKWLFIRTQLMRALTDTGGGYHLGVPNIISDHSSSFPSSILRFPLITPPGLKLNHSINYSSSPHSNHELGYKSHKSHKWNLPLDFYRSSIHYA